MVVQKDKFFLETTSVLDTGAQKQQLQKDLDYLKGFLVSVDKKLSNERFVQNAKPEVIETERKKKADAEEKIKLIEESLAEIDLAHPETLSQHHAGLSPALLDACLALEGITFFHLQSLLKTVDETLFHPELGLLLFSAPIPNTKRVLWPGQFAVAKLRVAERVTVGGTSA